MIVEPGTALSPVVVVETETALILREGGGGGGDSYRSQEGEVDGYGLMRIQRQEQGNGMTFKESLERRKHPAWPWRRSLPPGPRG